MRRAPVALLTLAGLLVGCGARSGLLELVGSPPGEDGGEDAPLDGPEPRDGAMPIPDATPDARRASGCPLSPPEPNQACALTVTLCAYTASLMPTPAGLSAWCCNAGSWVHCTTQSLQNESCADIVCGSDVMVECIVGDGAECCGCSADGTDDQCGPC